MNPTAEGTANLIPVASYSECSGTLVNVDGILQRFQKAVIKNSPLPELLNVVGQIGFFTTDLTTMWKDLNTSVNSLGGIDMQHIPAEGLALTVSEVNNVTA